MFFFTVHEVMLYLTADGVSDLVTHGSRHPVRGSGGVEWSSCSVLGAWLSPRLGLPSALYTSLRASLPLTMIPVLGKATSLSLVFLSSARGLAIWPTSTGLL